jgi:hypothetical protein
VGNILVGLSESENTSTGSRPQPLLSGSLLLKARLIDDVHLSMVVDPDGSAITTLDNSFSKAVGMQVNFVVVMMGASGTVHKISPFIYGLKC